MNKSISIFIEDHGVDDSTIDFVGLTKLSAEDKWKIWITFANVLADSPELSDGHKSICRSVLSNARQTMNERIRGIESESQHPG